MIEFTCSNIGVVGAQVYVIKTDDGYEARQALSFLGCYQMSESELEAIGYNPFNEAFNDNFARGTGSTEEEAVTAMKADVSSLAATMWL